MLIIGSKLINYPILSLHVGGQIATTESPIINPEGLKIIGYQLAGPLLKNPEVGNILDTTDVRELSPRGIIIDSIDNLVHREDIIRLDQVMSLNFHLIGLKVITTDGKKIGRVSDYTIDSASFTIYQVIVKRPAIKSILDPELTINRSQIIEIDDYQIIIKNEKEKITVKEKAKDFTPNFVNPFREPSYAPADTEED